MKATAFRRLKLIMFTLLGRLIGVDVFFRYFSLRCLPRYSEKRSLIAVHAVDVVSDAHVGQALLRVLRRYCL